VKIPLSPMDYYFFRRSLYTIQFVFEYQGHLDIQNLERSLDKVASIFIAVGSQIKIISDKEATLETGHSISLRSQVFEDEPAVVSTEPFLDPVNNCEGEPLVKVIVTQTPTRAFVGFSFSHLLGDGTSIFQFLDCLSKISISEGLNARPSNQRDLLKVPPTSELSLKNLFESTGYVVPRPPNPEGFTVETFKHSHHDLKRLKAICASEGVDVSSNDILMADLAKRFHRDIPLHDDKFVVRCPVDYRKILGLPSEYFGNAVRDAVAVFKVGEVDDLTLAEVALRIRRSIQSVDRPSIERSLKCLDAVRRDHGIGIFEEMGCPGLIVSNLSKFPIAKIDFGLGEPIKLHHASLNPRLGLILPSADGVVVQFKRPLAARQGMAAIP
jgi:NRPS condensation-like uncharacterized protein